MATTKLTKRIKSFDCFIPIEEAASKHVHLQILEGDITTQNIDAVVVFRHQSGSNEAISEEDSLKILNAAGDGINDEYATAKADGERHVAKGVVLTQAGDLPHARFIMHLTVNSNPVKLRETLNTTLKLAEKMNLRSISFPPLPYQLQSLTNKLFESIDDFIQCDRPICLHFIQLVVRDNGGVCQCANTKQRIEFEKYREILTKVKPRIGDIMTSSIGEKMVSPCICAASPMPPQPPPPKSEVTAYRQSILYRLIEYHVHAGLNNVYLHVKPSGDFYTKANSTTAYVVFREALWFSHCLSSNVDTTFPDMRTTEDITYSIIGNHVLFEITIDDSPGKFIRVQSAIQTILRYADEHGIQQVMFPSDFHYGNHQIELDLEFDKMYDDSKVIPLLYFQAISDYALYCRPCSVRAVHIHIIHEPQLKHVETQRKQPLINFSNLQDCYKSVKNLSPFRSIFSTMQSDSLIEACHLSIVHETLRVKRRKWKWSNCGDQYVFKDLEKYTNRYTYDRIIGNILPVQVPIELLLER